MQIVSLQEMLNLSLHICCEKEEKILSVKTSIIN